MPLGLASRVMSQWDYSKPHEIIQISLQLSNYEELAQLRAKGSVKFNLITSSIYSITGTTS
jgi:hypothetical protein